MAIAENEVARERLIEHWRRHIGGDDAEPRDRERHVEVFVSFEARDVETLAERLGISVSDEETQVILDRLDSEAVRLTRDAARQALRERIAELLGVVDHAHAESDDD